MKKYEIAYHNYAEAKRAHQVQHRLHSNLVSDILRTVKITANDQNDKIHCYFVI